MRKMLFVFVVLCLAAGFAASPADAAFQLMITEIWPGNDPGSNLTQDWFEITNVGDMAWTAAIDGDLYFDDDSMEPADADLMSGILSIAPGESVVYVDDADTTEFSDVWGPVKSLPQIGIYAGSGLGQSGDGVSVWISAVAPVGAPDLFASYPDATGNGGQSYDTVLGAFSVVGNASGAVATLALNDELQPAIGSPGMAVPEPGTLTLAGMGVAGLLLLAYRRRLK